MRRYSMSFAAAMSHKPENPERTAYRDSDEDIVFQVWPSRPAMLKSIELQERGNTRKVWRDWTLSRMAKGAV